METTHYRAELELLCCILLSPRLCNVLPEVVSTLPRSLVEKNLQPLLCLQHGSTAPFNHLPVHIKQFYSSSQQRLIFSLSLTPQPPIFFCTPHENQSAYTSTNTTFDLPELGSIRGNKRRSASKKGSSENNLHLSNVINDNRIMMVVGGRGKGLVKGRGWCWRGEKGGAWQKGKRIKDLLLSTDAAYVRDFL